MKKPVAITTERVDDIPLLLAQLKRMGVQELLDEHFPTHGNWQGLSLGHVAIIWLSHILSQADHRLNHVQTWVEHHLETVGVSLDQDLRGLDMSDDRLESLLRYLSKDSPWRSFEQALSQRQIQVYDLSPQRVRLDSTSVSGFWNVNEDGLFQQGHSKDHRPDLPQLKLMLATLDPLGLPIASEIVPGNAADDPLYKPAVDQVRQTLGAKGLLYVGDCKMGSLGTRYLIQSGGDYYLCPLSKTQVSDEDLQQYLLLIQEKKIELEEVSYDYANGTTAVIAQGYEQLHSCQFSEEGKEATWEERRLIVYSIAHGNAQKKSLQARIDQTQTDLESLNQLRRGKKPFQDLESFVKGAESIISKNRVQSLFQLRFQEQIEHHPQRRYRDRPARVVEKRRFQVDFTLDIAAVEQQRQLLGWRVYATNHPQPELSLSQAVNVYRQEYLIEQGFGRLKGHPLSLRPMFLQREDHIKGLIRLLTIGLRLLTLVEFQVRRSLALEKIEIAGLYAGNPKRSTAQPTAERLLASFKEITLVLIEARGETFADLTVLNPLQQGILKLMNFPIEIYTRLGPQSDDPP
jgi:transposase